MDSTSRHLETFDSSAEALRRLESNLAELGVPQPDEAGEAADLHLQAAHLCLSQATEEAADQAIEHLWSAWRLEPRQTEVRVLLTRALERAGRQRELAQLLWDASLMLEEDPEQTALRLRAALLFERLGEMDQSMEILRAIQASRSLPAQRPHLDALERLAVRLETTSRNEQEIEVRRMMVPLLSEERRYGCLRRIALLELQAGRVERAQEAYVGALELRPDFTEALEPVLSHLEEQRDFAEIKKVLLTAVAASNISLERRVLWRRLARLAEETLEEPAEAFDYWWRAWEMGPGGDESGPGGEEPDNLKRICTELKDWDRYHRVLLRESKIASDVHSKVEILHELATFQREVLQDEMAAVATYDAILQLVPDDALSHTARLEVFDDQGMADELATAMRRYVSHCREPHLRDESLRRLARLEFDEGDGRQLLSLLGQLDHERGENRRFIEELWEDARAGHRPQTAVAVGGVMLPLLRTGGQGPEEQITAMLALAELCQQMHRYGPAVDYLHQVLELQEDHPQARARLKELDHRGQLFDPTSVTLAIQAEECVPQRPQQAIRLLIQAAQVVEHQPHPEPEAIARYLRRALELYDPKAQAQAEGQLLECALREAALYEELIQVLELEAEHAENPLEQKSILRVLSQVYRDDVGDPVGAVGALERLIELDPKDLETAEQIRRLYAELGNYRSLAGVLENLLDATSGRGRIPLLAELGQLYAQRLDDQPSALGRYGELLSFVPDHHAALAYCRAHDEAAEEYRSIAVLLCRAAEAAADPLDRAEFHHEIAQIAEQRLGDLDFAIAQWRQVIELCPADTAPRAELRRILKDVGRWREVAEALLSDVARSLSPEDKVPIYIELSHVSREQLGDERTAAGYLRLAQQLAPTNKGILTELEAIFEDLEQWHELAVVLRRHAELEPAVAERVALLNRAARTLFARLRRADEALAVCRYIREMNAGDRASATLMGEIFSDRGQWRELIVLLREQAQEESGPRSRDGFTWSWGTCSSRNARIPARPPPASNARWSWMRVGERSCPCYEASINPWGTGIS